MDESRQPTIAPMSPQSMPTYPDAISTIFASRARMPASVTARVSRLSLAYDFPRTQRRALTRSKLLPSLRHGGHDAFPPSFRKTAIQNRHQFDLRIDIEFFGGI